MGVDKEPDVVLHARHAAQRIKNELDYTFSRVLDNVESSVRSASGLFVLNDFVGRERFKAGLMQLKAGHAAEELFNTIPLAKMSVRQDKAPAAPDANRSVADADCTLASDFPGSGSETSTTTTPSRLAMSIVGHAQASLDNAQENFKSLLPDSLGATEGGADSALAPFRVNVPGFPGLEAVLKNPEEHFGDLWGTTSPQFGPFKLQKRKYADEDPEYASCLNTPGRSVNIFTTACLPWLTGTSINPLLRAHYLANPAMDRQVTLYVPWLNKADQSIVYPHNLSFETPEAQEKYVREWVTQRTGQDTKHFSIAWYPGRYAPEKGSILPVGDITQWVPEHQADVAILEEPEHLTWYHHGGRWTSKFRHVVGIMHTNYLDYARREENGALKAFMLRMVNNWVCRAHCHKVVKLSDAVQDLPRQCTQFVHGVSPKFLEVGAAKARAATQAAENAAAAAAAAVSPQNALASLSMPGSSGGVHSNGAGAMSTPPVWPQGAYFLGKVVWAKGYTELLDLMEKHHAKGNAPVQMDIFGTGVDKQEVEERARSTDLQLRFHGAKDHADDSLQNYKVFVNPSLSDVVATTTAEALAMGKFVVCAQHPSNAFFSSFRNCITYRTADEFSAKLQYALSNSPEPMSPSELERLTWFGATDRFVEAVAMAPTERIGWVERAFDHLAASAHNTMTGVEAIRMHSGAGAGTRETPCRVTDYTPTSDDFGGLWDNHARAATARSKRA